MLQANLKSEVELFIDQNWDQFREDAAEYGGLQITIATNDDGDLWNYQTGDNSFTGGCYGLPHWAVNEIDEDSDMGELLESIFEQLEEAQYQ